MVSISPIGIHADDIPGSLAEAIRLLPGFEPYSEGWEEPSLDEHPQVGAVFAGEVGEVEVSVSKLRSGSVQLMFAFDAEGDELLEGEATCGVAWLLPSTVQIVDEDGLAILPSRFQAEGYLHAILEHEELLSAVRHADEILGKFLFGNPKEFMALEANYSRREGGDLVPILDEGLDGNAFLRIFTYRVAMATS